MHILLETDRLRLRRFTAADVDLLVDLDADPQVMRYITYGKPTPREAYVARTCRGGSRSTRRSLGLGYFAAERRDTGAFLGWFHLRDDRLEPEYVELGYRFRQAAWRQGYATEGARALLQHGFIHWAWRRSRRARCATTAGRVDVMEKCGLRFAADFVYPEDVIAGRSEDERAAVKYVITRREWLSRRR